MNNNSEETHTTSTLMVRSNDLLSHDDILLKAYIRQAVVSTTYNGDFTLDDALEVLREEVAWLERKTR